MESTIKTKKCSVKLNRMSFVGITPQEVQVGREVNSQFTHTKCEK